MYYESRQHVLVPCSGVADAAKMIKQGRVERYECLTYTSAGVDYLLTDNTDCDDITFGEVAVLRKEADGSFTEIESITAAWIDTPEALAEYFRKAMEEPFLPKKNCQILMAGTPLSGTETGPFTCSCCGAGFKGSVKEQLNFGLDDGYGLCPECK